MIIIPILTAKRIVLLLLLSLYCFLCFFKYQGGLKSNYYYEMSKDLVNSQSPTISHYVIKVTMYITPVAKLFSPILL